MSRHHLSSKTEADFSCVRSIDHPVESELFVTQLQQVTSATPACRVVAPPNPRIRETLQGRREHAHDGAIAPLTEPFGHAQRIDGRDDAIRVLFRRKTYGKAEVGEE